MLNCGRNYFDVLELEPKMYSVADVKSAYKKMALVVHPDKSKVAKAEDAFKKVSNAYIVLSDIRQQKKHLSGLKLPNRVVAYQPSEKTAQQVWEHFQKEEEMFLSKQFKTQQNKHTVKRKGKRKTSATKDEQQLKYQKEMLESFSDERVGAWQIFHGKVVDKDQLCCLLCKRRFKEKSTLERHVEESILHKNNLAAANVSR